MTLDFVPIDDLALNAQEFQLNKPSNSTKYVCLLPDSLELETVQYYTLVSRLCDNVQSPMLVMDYFEFSQPITSSSVSVGLDTA
jgi:hypothetical protein